MTPLFNNVKSHVTQFYNENIRQHVDAVITQDNSRMQVMFYAIPLAGPIFQLLRELKLHGDYDAAINNPNPLAERTNVLRKKNETTKCGITAFAIQAIVFALLAMAAGSGFLGLCMLGTGILAGIHVLRLMHNEKALVDLPQAQIPPLLV